MNALTSTATLAATTLLLMLAKCLLSLLLLLLRSLQLLPLLGLLVSLLLVLILLLLLLELLMSLLPVPLMQHLNTAATTRSSSVTVPLDPKWIRPMPAAPVAPQLVCAAKQGALLAAAVGDRTCVL
jgi:hypothetical protein